MHREESARNRPKERPGPYYLAVHSIIRVMRRHHACIERRVADLDIHHSQHRLLLHLARFESIPSQKEIAEAAFTLGCLLAEGDLGNPKKKKINHVSFLNVKDDFIALT